MSDTNRVRFTVKSPDPLVVQSTFFKARIEIIGTLFETARASHVVRHLGVSLVVPILSNGSNAWTL